MNNKVRRNGTLKSNFNYLAEKQIEKCVTKSFGNLHTWYINQKYGVVMLIMLFIIDIAGFYQIISNTLYEEGLIRGVIISGFGVAFELAPLYIGYTLCLIFYNWAIQRFNKLMLFFSVVACMLGIVANTAYRFLTIGAAYSDDIEPETALAITITMCILPIITSLINLVIGCLAFDPLYIHLVKLSKQISVLQIRERKLKAFLEEYKSDDICKEGYESEVKGDFQSIEMQIKAINTELKSYIDMRCNVDNQGV